MKAKILFLFGFALLSASAYSGQVATYQGASTFDEAKKKSPYLQVLNSTQTTGIAPGKLFVITAKEGLCNKMAREFFVYSNFCRGAKTGILPGWFPKDTCERAEKARKGLSLAFNAEVVYIDPPGGPNKELDLSSSAAYDRSIQAAVAPPPECKR